MKKFIITTVLSVFLTGCNENIKQHKDAQALGEKHAREIVEQNLTDTQIALKLLDVRAWEHKISSEVDSVTAGIYIQSFSSYLMQNADSIATVIFNDSIDY